MKTQLGLAALPVALENITVRYGAFTAVDDLSLAIAPGEILALLGPSGCGKTTTLKAITGLQAVDAGRIRFGAEDVTEVAPHRRGVGMVFQNYALFPHLNVTENVAFGLAMHGVEKAERAARATGALALLQIGELAAKYPGQLSGGQQQRVALARTLVVRPKVLLLDEPLSALDRQLRDVMRTELRRLLKEVGITAIIVTHDQDEALTLADRVAVMNAGRIEQIDSPRDIYASPRTRFVAGFIGQTNTLRGTITSLSANGALVRLDAHNEILARPMRTVAIGETVEVAIRPEAFSLSPVPDAMRLIAQATGETYAGGTTEWHFRLAGGQVFRVLSVADGVPAQPLPHLRPGRALILE